jgi:hypothetical protein
VEGIGGHRRGCGHHVDAQAQQQVQRAEAERLPQAARGFGGDQQQVGGLAPGHQRIQRVARIRAQQQHAHADQVQQQRQPGQGPEQQAQSGMAARRRGHVQHAAVGEAQGHAAGRQRLRQLLLRLQPAARAVASSTIQRAVRRSTLSSSRTGAGRWPITVASVRPAMAPSSSIGLDSRVSCPRAVGLPAGVEVRAAGHHVHQRKDHSAAQQRRQHQQAQPPADPAPRFAAHQGLFERAGVEARIGAGDQRLGTGLDGACGPGSHGRLQIRRTPKVRRRRSAQRRPGGPLTRVAHTRPCLLASTAASARLDTLSFL